MAKDNKDVQSIETRDGVTIITYTDGTREEQTGGVEVNTDTISGGISFG